MTLKQQDPKTDEAEENNLKKKPITLGELFEPLKNEMKNSFKDREGKANKKEINKFLRENKETAIKLVKEMIQDLKTEIDNKENKLRESWK